MRRNCQPPHPDPRHKLSGGSSPLRPAALIDHFMGPPELLKSHVNGLLSFIRDSTVDFLICAVFVWMQRRYPRLRRLAVDPLRSIWLRFRLRCYGRLARSTQTCYLVGRASRIPSPLCSPNLRADNGQNLPWGDRLHGRPLEPRLVPRDQVVDLRLLGAGRLNRIFEVCPVQAKRVAQAILID
jgi:hypothetical protein